MLKFLKGLFENKAPVKVKPPFYPIVCPYCFSKFQPDEVVFRAAHHRDDDQDYALQEDEALNKYREKFNLAAIDELEAVIHPETIPSENMIISENVLVGLTDRHGVVTRKRLCPHCHNELPLPSGKVPSNIISIVGSSESGKTVYLASLIHTLQQSTAYNFSAACMPLNADVSRRFRQNYEEPIFERGTMIESTQAGDRQEPYIFQFVFKDESVPPLTLVFFDVAGEGLVEEAYYDVYAAHIKNSSGILFMVDPLQIKTIRDRLKINFGEREEEFARKHDEPREVVITMYQKFIGHEEKGVTEIPTAIVLTKSDMLQHLKEEDGDYIKSNSNVFRNVVHSKTLDLNEFNNINGEISRFMEKVDRPFKDAVGVYFKNTAYFAVSALGSNPVNRQITGVVNPIRVDEPFIWLLYKLNYIEGSNPQ
jgi:hypothetical protein